MKFIELNQTQKNKITITKAGAYTIFLFNRSGKVILEIKVKDVDINIYGLFIGKGSENFHLNTIQHHSEVESTSNLLIKGIFFDQSEFYYEGLIKIDLQAQRSHAYQKNQNIILGSKARVESKPYLEIEANDVFCTHGSTTGKISPNQIHYLQTRGINKKKAEKLILQGFTREIFDLLTKAGVSSKIVTSYQNKVKNILSNAS